MDLATLNALPESECREALARCCGARRWVDGMLARRPYPSVDAVKREATEVWLALEESDWREAFTHHPKIGDVDALRKKFASTAAWASGEQAGASAASEPVLRALAEGNREYEAKFGYIFIICATGKSAEEMLAALERRLHHEPDVELRIAAGEQDRITHLRLEKLLAS